MRRAILRFVISLVTTGVMIEMAVAHGRGAAWSVVLVVIAVVAGVALYMEDGE